MSNSLSSWIADSIVDIDYEYAHGGTSAELIVPAELARDAVLALHRLGYNAMRYRWFQEPLLAAAGRRLIKVWWVGKP